MGLPRAHIESGAWAEAFRGISRWHGCQMGPYVLEEIIGVGGLSAVYLARHKDSANEKVAVKLLLPDYAGEFAETLFRQESRALCSIRHPHVIRCLAGGAVEEESGTDRGYFLALEYVPESRSLESFARQVNRSAGRVVQAVLQTAEAMQVVHAAGIVHNDLKAGNILINAQGQVKIIDFGIASFYDSATKTDTPAYTPFIAAPEQIMGKAITPQADVFILGATLLHALTGQNPLPEFTPQSYSPLRDEHRALRIKRSHRYRDMAGFAADLSIWLKSTAGLFG